MCPIGLTGYGVRLLQLIYLIIIVSIGKAAVPVISLAMLGAVYGLQVGYLEPSLI